MTDRVVVEDGSAGGGSPPPPSAPTGLPPRFGRNLVVSYWVPVVRGLALLVVTPIVLHRLGDDAFGIWALIGSAVAYLELLDFGFGLATVKLVAEDARHHRDEVVRTVNTLFFVTMGFGVLILVVGLVLAANVEHLFKVPVGLEQAATIAFVLLVVDMSVSVPGDTFGGALAGHARFDLLGLSNIAQAAVTAVITVLLVTSGGGLVALAAASAGVGISMHAARFLLLRRLVPGLRLSPRLVDRQRVRRSAGISSWLMLRNIASMVNLRVDLVVIGVALGARQVALYAVGLKLSQVLDRGVKPLSAMMMPEASTLEREGNWDRLRALLTSGTRATLIVAVPIAAVLVVLARPAVRAWVGEGYGTGADVLAVLAAALGIRAMSTTADSVIIGIGRVRLAAVTQGIEAAVNLGVSLALVKPLGPVGVAFGTMAGTVVRLLMLLPVASRATGATVRGLVVEAFAPHLVPAAAVTAGLLVLAPVVSGPLAVVAMGGAAGLVYIAIYYFTGATPGERRQVQRLVRRVLRRPPARPLTPSSTEASGR